MEDYQGNCCEKFFRTSRQQESSPARIASNPKNREAPEAVTIEFDHTSKLQQKDGKLHQIAPGKSAPKQGNGQSEQGEFPKNGQPQGSREAAGKKTVQHIEDRFTDFINRAKSKLRRTMSNVGEGKSSPVEKNHHGGKDKDHHDGKESKEHHFLDYIKRAGMKIRTTTFKDRTE
ncbi:hypothetical protein SLEP1_g48620 [Rubroshorea leprosula]|uniref:Uncharacterized protein n=1 Tax=Rubroshorea leprosula TaxID=152421 RepID=A0AAV5LUE0_9ROSI|nr:hypothetical protein SLEP1_g48620 [Rubroshorea leprosula]